MCALLDRFEGMTFIQRNAESRQDCNVKIICAAEVYDDLFRSVREWARQGYSAEHIQAEIDTRFDELLQLSAVVGKHTIAHQQGATRPSFDSYILTPEDEEVLDSE